MQNHLEEAEIDWCDLVFIWAEVHTLKGKYMYNVYFSAGVCIQSKAGQLQIFVEQFLIWSLKTTLFTLFLLSPQNDVSKLPYLLP